MSDVSHISSAAHQVARREIAMLPRLLKSGEQVIDICCGTADGKSTILVLTDRRVMYMQRRRIWGARVETTPLAHVRSAQEQFGIRHATVTVDAGGRVFSLSDVDRTAAPIFCARVRSQLQSH